MNKKVVGALGLAAVALVGGTFAYFTQTSTIDNPFDTAKYGTVVVEDFKPEDGEDWTPGAQVNKDLYVDNTGDRPVVVRVKFEDFWSRNGVVFKELNSTDSMEIGIGDPTDGETDPDKSVVHKYFDNADGWSKLQPDGYYYYLKKLEPAGSANGADTTGKFLDSVRLDANTDMGKLMTQFYYMTDKDRVPLTEANISENGPWMLLGDPQPAIGAVATPGKAIKDGKEVEIEGVTFTGAITKAEDKKLGYSDANYVLRITVETVQATDKAVAQVFSTADSSIVAGWNLDKEDLESTTP